MAFTDAAATWNRRFAGETFLFGTEPNAWLRAHAGWLAPGSRVLCVADGEGRNSVFLARQGHRVEAFDIAANAVAKAQAFAAREGVQVGYALADCDSYAWPSMPGDAFDAVAAIFVQFADPPQRQRLFANMVRALKPGGLLLLHGYTPKQLEYRTGGPPILEHLYTEAMLREAFAGSAEIVELTEYEAEIHEGSGHSGRSALLGLVARRPA
ncbi:MAG: class I SAM-dependent methyltransferase [Rubrivivax sp.]|nr:class I SAM-dependent methyltransferase [Rubrivivax sp.]